MTRLAEVLAWKFNNAPGIRTREGSNRRMEIFDWPEALGNQPTDTDIAKWTKDFDKLPPQSTPEDDLDAAIAKASTLSELKAALKGRVSTRRT